MVSGRQSRRERAVSSSYASPASTPNCGRRCNVSFLRGYSSKSNAQTGSTMNGGRQLVVHVPMRRVEQVNTARRARMSMDTGSSKAEHISRESSMCLAYRTSPPQRRHRKIERIKEYLEGLVQDREGRAITRAS